MKTNHRLIQFFTGFLAFFMLIPGLVKFAEPFSTFFKVQMEQSNFPLPVLSHFLGQGGEIISGLVLFFLLFAGRKIAAPLMAKTFAITHGVIGIILIIALYVHAHPAVEAEVLPFEMKFPLLTLVMLFMVIVNLRHYYIHKDAVDQGKYLL